MRTALRTLIALLACAMPALAAGQASEEGSILIILFIGFGAVILISQLFPGVAMFTVMLKEIFTGTRKKVAASARDAK